jgi:hypothetical protein
MWGTFNQFIIGPTILGGPIIGFRFKSNNEDFSLVLGDKCMPKYFGARKLSIRPGVKLTVTFYWQ